MAHTSFKIPSLLWKTRSFAFIGLIAGLVVACRPQPTAICAGLAIITMPPVDTSVALGKSIVVGAGEGGECNNGPVTFTTLAYWKAVDSTVVSIAVLDSVHARVTGRTVGTTDVIASQSPVFADTWYTTHVRVQ